MSHIPGFLRKMSTWSGWGVIINGSWSKAVGETFISADSGATIKQLHAVHFASSLKKKIADPRTPQEAHWKIMRCKTESIQILKVAQDIKCFLICTANPSPLFDKEKSLLDSCSTNEMSCLLLMFVWKCILLNRGGFTFWRCPCFQGFSFLSYACSLTFSLE